jgi:hypothetical protein
MSNVRKFFCGTLVVAALSSLAAFAAGPANIVGTWQALISNKFETRVITAQDGPGAPGASECRIVTGTIGIAPVGGFYCPGNGRVHLLHNNLSTVRPVRDFTGLVSEDATTGRMHMAGSFNILSSAFGNFGEYPFTAVK